MTVLKKEVEDTDPTTKYGRARKYAEKWTQGLEGKVVLNINVPENRYVFFLFIFLSFYLFIVTYSLAHRLLRLALQSFVARLQNDYEERVKSNEQQEDNAYVIHHAQDILYRITNGILLID